MIVQIHEVTSPAEAHALGAIGVDHIGVLIGDGSFPREQTIERASQILAAFPPRSKASALSLSHDLDLIMRITRARRQTSCISARRHRFFRHRSSNQSKTSSANLLDGCIPVVDESSIALARSYDGIADWLLLDTYESGDRQIGALGVTHSWELDRHIIRSVRIPTIIARGLGPKNVQDAIRVARPAGVDSKTKTDRSDGTHTRDLQKVSAFIEAARSASSGNPAV